MKRLAILMVFCIFTGMLFPLGAEAATTSFTDTKTHWAKDYIATVANAGYVTGYYDGTFKPDKVITRAEFTSVLMRCLGHQPVSGASSFSDMGSHWGNGYVNKAVALGIIVPSDYGSTFGPNAGLKRSEICGMLVRALGKKPDNSPTGFKDSAAINKSVMRGYIKVACDLKLLSGYPNGNFEPFQEVTRAQMCKVIINFMSAQGKDLESAPATAATTTTSDTQTTTSLSGDFTTLAIGDQEYALATTPVTFKINMTNVPATILSKQLGALFINGQYRFVLDSPVSNLSVVINDTLYEVNQFSASGSRLIIYPGKRKIASVTVSGHKYDSTFINMYVNSAAKGYYLSDLSILNNSSVELNSAKYNLPGDKITIELGNDFYDITALTLSSTATTPILTLTNSVIARGYTLSNVAAIFVGTNNISLSSISTLQFLIDGQIYNLSEINIDASGNINISGNTYDCKKVSMLVNSVTQYKINSISLTNGKLFFYCADAATNYNMVLLDNKYRDASKLTIYKDGVAYALDHVVIVSRNLVRIGGKQYSLDSSFKVNYDGITYYIDEMNYNSSLQVPVINTSNKAAGVSSPVSYNFFVNNSLIQSGANSQTTIYTSNMWVTFSNITVSDPANFTYSSTTYALIGSLVKIGSTQYRITDTAWRGSSQILELYLKEI